MVSRAIEVNDQLQKVLARHDALLSARPSSTVDHFNQEEAEEEEEAEQLFRRFVNSSNCPFFFFPSSFNLVFSWNYWGTIRPN